MSGSVHVVGAGLAGLAAAVRLSGAGRRVVLHESSACFGGRCRSYDDPVLGCRVDNGNHLLLSGNRTALGYIDRLGSRNRLIEVRPAAIPFLDLPSGRCWTLRPNPGPVPWWLLSSARRVPGTRPADYLPALRLLRAPAGATVTDILPPDTPLFSRLWEPLAVSALNLDPRTASARLLGAVVARTLLRGEAACRPLIAREGLADCLVDPALARLEREGAVILRNSRLRRLEATQRHARRLIFSDGTAEIGPSDAVILAVPPARAGELLPDLRVPPEGPAIVNAHFRLQRRRSLPGDLPLLALIGGTAEWLFIRDSVVSVTVSAADDLAGRDAEEVAALLWADVARALGDPRAGMPERRIVKERRATFLQTPAGAALRPGPAFLANLFLAGDWTDTGLPATIEGAVLSGNRAAELALRRGC
jgi:squalene-associated FAD-dependent desaturase